MLFNSFNLVKRIVNFSLHRKQTCRFHFTCLVIDLHTTSWSVLYLRDFLGPLGTLLQCTLVVKLISFYCDLFSIPTRHVAVNSRHVGLWYSCRTYVFCVEGRKCHYKIYHTTDRNEKFCLHKLETIPLPLWCVLVNVVIHLTVIYRKDERILWNNPLQWKKDVSLSSGILYRFVNSEVGLSNSFV